MRAQPIVYVTTMSRSIEWYASLLQREPTTASDHWTTFAIGDATLALHSTDDALNAGDVSLSLVATEPLEAIRARVQPATEIIDQAFGRSFTAIDPDGIRIQVNEHLG